MLRRAAVRLKKANSINSASEKVAKASKEFLAGWLQKNRNLDLEKLQIGELVHIEGIVLIEIGKQNKFDTEAFSSVQPQTFEKFKRDFPTKKFKPLA